MISFDYTCIAWMRQGNADIAMQTCIADICKAYGTSVSEITSTDRISEGGGNAPGLVE